jgi:hypothetical protein
MLLHEERDLDSVLLEQIFRIFQNSHLIHNTHRVVTKILIIYLEELSVVHRGHLIPTIDLTS